MRFTLVILSALLCLSARAETAATAADKDSDDAIVAAAEKLVEGGRVSKAEAAKAEATSTPADATPSGQDGPQGEIAPAAPVAAVTAIDATIQESKKENEIPVFTKSEKVAKSENSLIWRLVTSMLLLAVVGGAMIFATKRYARKKNTGGDKVRIEVLHRYQLSPKNSLALVRVAGEAILIGCTDQSVNMLKTVTLIDDELEGLLGKDFNGFLEDDFKIEDMRSALQPRS
jgi:flagellar protein FliO/FliZ